MHYLIPYTLAMSRPEIPDPAASPSGQPTDGNEYYRALFLHTLANLRLSADVRDRLAELGMGRIHNRLLGIATGIPGITVGETLDVLSVTHQNIRLPMKTLIQQGYLIARVDDADRRARRLYATPSGARLITELLGDQSERLRRAFDQAGPDAVAGFFRVHELLLDDRDRYYVDRIHAKVGSLGQD